MRPISYKYLAFGSILAIFACKSITNKAPAVKQNAGSEVQNDIILVMDSLFQNERLDTLYLKFDFEIKKPNKKYRGLYTHKMFLSLVEKYQIDTSQNEVLFICKDGYSASVPFYQLLNDKGFVANKDIEAKLQWEEAINDKFSPYYLVWDMPQRDANHQFPYAVAQIKIVNKIKEFADAYPTHSSPEIEQGFAIFKKTCLKCHKVNKIGGTMGQELNIPKSVTEYWKIEHLKAFIKNPSSYKDNCKMPKLTELTNKDIDLIVDYLVFMAEHKKY